MLERSFLYGKEIIIYGAGNSYNVFESFVLKKLKHGPLPKILAHIDKKFTVVDRNCRKKSVDWLLSTERVRRFGRVPVVVCIGNRFVLNEIVTNLLDAGYADVFSMYDFWDFHAAYDERNISEIGTEIQSLKPSFVSSRRNLLCDAHSKLVFDEFISNLVNPSKPSVTQSPPEDEQLEPAIQFFNPQSEAAVRVLNTGAYRGEFYKAFLEKFPGMVGELYLLEPNTSNFKEFSYLDEHTRNHALIVKCFNLGVSNIERYTQLTGQGVSSRMNSFDSGASTCQIRFVPIDDFFSNVSFTHLVIDIEGYERNFLLGARGIISKFRPNICISVYHYPMDIFNIMTVIDDMEPGYNFFIRNYSGYNTDTLLYAIRN